MKNTKVVSGFPGIGKSFIFNEESDLIVLDSDSSQFSWISPGVRHPDFPNNYIHHIQNNLGKADIILVSSHDIVREALKINSIEYVLVYPDRTLKQEYLQRYKDRENKESFLDFFNSKWDEFINQMEEEAFPQTFVLEKGQYLKDVIEFI